ncbi:hypothetical protein LZ30DRAFT_251756 [Colletotrichum cereale]|nr:hypothetical protein LZ30DRAFT_251756 [Colletotrichum cereale]
MIIVEVFLLILELVHIGWVVGDMKRVRAPEMRVGPCRYDLQGLGRPTRSSSVDFSAVLLAFFIISSQEESRRRSFVVRECELYNRTNFETQFSVASCWIYDDSACSTLSSTEAQAASESHFEIEKPREA